MSLPIVQRDQIAQALKDVKAHNHTISHEEACHQVALALCLPVEVVQETAALPEHA